MIKVNSLQNKITIEVKINTPKKHKNDRENRVISMNMVTDRMNSYFDVYWTLSAICLLLLDNLRPVYDHFGPLRIIVCGQIN